MRTTIITAVVAYNGPDKPSKAAVSLMRTDTKQQTTHLETPAGTPYRALVAWCLDMIRDMGKQVLLKEADIDITDRPAHGGYPSPGPTVPMTGVPITLAELQRQTADQLRRDSTPQALLKSKVLKPRKPWPEETEEEELDVIALEDIAETMPPVQDPRLKILSDFVRTAPGRLPEAVQNALVPEGGTAPIPHKVIGLIELECASGIVQCWCGCSKFHFHSDNWTYTCGSCASLFDSRMPVKPFDLREPL